MQSEHTRIYKRKAYMREIVGMVTTAGEGGKGLDKEKLIGVCCYKWGTARRTVMEYIKTIVQAGLIIETEIEGKTFLLDNPVEDE